MGDGRRSVRPRRGLRLEREELVRSLRDSGATWVEVAEVFRQRYAVNPRIALRLARGWSQPRAADEWWRRWPDDPKTLKNFSYWENWPSSTGREPHLRVLARLAELYECNVSDLVADVGCYGSRDSAALQLGFWVTCSGCGTVNAAT